MRANVWKELENYFLILLGTALMAIAIQWIFDRVGLITGGFTGLTIIIRNLTEALLPGGIPLWLTNIVLDIAFVIGLHRGVAGYSDISVFLYPVWKKLYRENGLCNHFAFGVALSDTGDRYVRG